MSHGTTQEKATIALELGEGQQECALKLAADLRRAEDFRLQVKQAKKLESSQQRELTLQQEQKRSQGLGMGV